MTQIEVRFHWSEIDQIAASKAMRRNLQPPVWQTLLLFGLTFAISATLALVFEPKIMGAAILCTAIGVWGMILFQFLQAQTIRRGIATSPARQAEQRLIVTPDGYQIISNLSETTTQWSAVLDIVEAKDMVLLCIGRVEYIPVRDADLPDGWTRTAFVIQLRRWMEAGK